MPIKVLIIEDELALQQTLKLNLELENYKVDTCSSGGDAISVIKILVPI
jgi:DNA-binding response OmpR family regulator